MRSGKLNDRVRAGSLELPRPCLILGIGEPFLAAVQRLDGGKGAELVETRENKWEPFCAEEGIRITHVKVKVRSRRAASRVAELADDLAGRDPVTCLHRDAALLQVLVEGESAAPQVEGDVVPARVLELGRAGPGSGKSVVRDVVHCGYNRGIGHGQDLGAEAVPIGSLRALIAVDRSACSQSD